MSKRVVTINEALRVLADMHTRDDDQVGFVVEYSPNPHLSFWTQDEYIKAWQMVRERLHMKTEPSK